MVYTANHAVIVHHIFTPWLDVILRETQTHDKDADRRIIILYHTRVRSLSSFITVLLSKIFSTGISDYILTKGTISSDRLPHKLAFSFCYRNT